MLFSPDRRRQHLRTKHGRRSDFRHGEASTKVNSDDMLRVYFPGVSHEVYNTEQQLLYVVCTRARDQLLITSVAPASEFLDDMRK